jgi:tetratricopeptide (TPR) repeat protein
LLIKDYSLVIVGGALLGLWIGFRRNITLSSFLLAPILIYTIAIAAFHQSPEVSNYFFPIFVCVMAFVTVGIVGLVESKQRYLAKVSRRIRYGCCVGILLLVVLVMAAITFPRLDRRNLTMFSDLGENLIGGLEKDSVLLTMGDLPIATVLYQQTVNKLRQDVELVAYRHFARVDWYRDQMKGRIKFYDIGPAPPADYVLHLLEMNPGRNFYITELAFLDKRFFDRYRPVPAGMMYKIVQKGAASSIPEALWSFKTGNPDWPVSAIYTTSKGELFNVENMKHAAENFYLNYLMSNDLSRDPGKVRSVVEECGRIYGSMQSKFKTNAEREIVAHVRKTVFDTAHENFGYGNIDQVRTLFTNLLTAFPEDGDFHLALGNLYFRIGKLESAEAEYNATLRIDPNHPQRAFVEGRLAEIGKRKIRSEAGAD